MQFKFLGGHKIESRNQTLIPLKNVSFIFVWESCPFYSYMYVIRGFLTDAAPLRVRHVVEPPVVPLFLVNVTVVLRTAASPEELERVSWDI